MNRGLISFDSHIIDSVMEKVGDKYTRKQVEDVLFSSLSYIHCLCRYTDNVEVSIPYLGSMVCNLREMRSRYKKLNSILNKKGSLSDDQQIELNCLETKINDIQNNKSRIKNGDLKTRSLKEFNRTLRYGLKFDNIQDIQQRKYY